MKKITLLLLIFVLTFTTSCDPEDTVPSTTYKLVKIESFNPNDVLNYTTTIEYNNDGFVSKAIEVSSSGTNTTNYIYSNGKIVSFTSPNYSANFTYTGDLITSSEETDGTQTAITTYTYNSNNQVIHTTTSNGGSSAEEHTFTYDSNNNILSDTSNGIVYNYTYDSKNNPSNLALPNAILKIYFIGQNNVLSDGSSSTYTYEYNTNGYPTKINYFYNGVLESYSIYTYEEI